MGSWIPCPTKKKEKNKAQRKQGDTDGHPIDQRGFVRRGLRDTYLHQTAVMEIQAASGDCIRLRPKEKNTTSTVSRRDLVTHKPQTRKRRKRSVKVVVQEMLPFSGEKAIAMSRLPGAARGGTVERGVEGWARGAGACRSVWNTIARWQPRISDFYSTGIGLCCRPL